MTAAQLKTQLQLETICEGSPEREVTSGYCGDLLSWVMGRAPADSVWVTIMGNINVIAVASLADVACVVLADGVKLDEDARVRAVSEGMNVYSSAMGEFELCRAVEI
jgi:DRTGG domain.